jgi:hypothetical protein
MTIDPALQALLGQLAARLRLADLRLDQNGACALRFDDQIRIDFQYRADREHLVAYADLGVPAAGPALYPTLLRANLFWRTTFGGTLSLSDDSPPHVVLAITHDWRSLNVVSLTALVERFVATTEDWQELIQSPPQAAEDRASPVALPSSEMIFRV